MPTVVRIVDIVIAQLTMVMYCSTESPMATSSPSQNQKAELLQPRLSASRGCSSQTNLRYSTELIGIQNNGSNSPPQHESSGNLTQSTRRCSPGGVNQCSTKTQPHHCCSASESCTYIQHPLVRNGYVSNGYITASGSDVRLVKGSKSMKQWDKIGVENGVTAKARRQNIQNFERYFPRSRALGLRSSISNTPNSNTSGSSHITQMDSNTKKLLAALDSGELASSLLENPFC